MNNLNNDLGNLVTICPYCKAKYFHQFPILDLYAYTQFKKNISKITLHKSLNKTIENELFLKTLLLNSLKKKPFISRIIITKPYREVIEQLIKTNFITNNDLQNINLDLY